MSPTEFSNYLKQRSMQQQQQPMGQNPMGQPPNHFGPIGSISPSRSISPSTFANQLQNDPKFFLSNLNMNMYPFGGSPRNGFDNAAQNNGFPSADPFYIPLGGNKMQQQQQPQQQANNLNASALSPIGQGSVQHRDGRDANTSNSTGGGNNAATNDKLIDGLNAYYSSNPGSYHHLLVAN